MTPFALGGSSGDDGEQVIRRQGVHVEKPLGCPYCKKPIPRKWIGLREFRCDHCRAPVRFGWPLRSASYLITVAVAVSLLVLLQPYSSRFISYTTSGHIDRASLSNFLIMASHLLPGLVLGEIVVQRFGTLKLANPKWPLRLSVAERNLMRKYSITANGEYFIVDGLDFDSLQQAVDYACANKRHTRK